MAERKFNEGEEVNWGIENTGESGVATLEAPTPTQVDGQRSVSRGKMNRWLKAAMLVLTMAAAAGCGTKNTDKYNDDHISGPTNPGNDQLGTTSQALTANMRNLGVICTTPHIDTKSNKITCGDLGTSTRTVAELSFAGSDFLKDKFTKKTLSLPTSPTKQGWHWQADVASKNLLMTGGVSGLGELVAGKFNVRYYDRKGGPDWAMAFGNDLFLGANKSSANPITSLDVTKHNGGTWAPTPLKGMSSIQSLLTDPVMFYPDGSKDQGWFQTDKGTMHYAKWDAAGSKWKLSAAPYSLPANTNSGISIQGCDANSPNTKWIVGSSWPNKPTGTPSLWVSKTTCPTTPGEPTTENNVEPKPEPTQPDEPTVKPDGGTEPSAPDNAPDGGSEPVKPDVAPDSSPDAGEPVVDGGNNEPTVPDTTKDGGTEPVQPDTNVGDKAPDSAPDKNPVDNGPDTKPADKTPQPNEFKCGDGASGKLRAVPGQKAPKFECKGIAMLATGAGVMEYQDYGNVKWTKIKQEEIDGCAKSVFPVGGHHGAACGTHEIETRGQKISSYHGSLVENRVYGLVLGYEGTKAKFNIVKPLKTDQQDLIKPQAKVSAVITSDKDTDGSQTAINVTYFAQVKDTKTGESKRVQVDMGKLSKDCSRFGPIDCSEDMNIDFADIQKRAEELAKQEPSEKPLPDRPTEKPGCGGCSTNPDEDKKPTWPVALGVAILAAFRRRKRKAE